MYIQADQFQKLEENLNIDHCNHATIINKILITSFCWILTACSKLKNGLKALKETLTGSFLTQVRQHFLNCCLDKYFSCFVFGHFRSGVQMIRALQCSVCSRTLRGFRQGRGKAQSTKRSCGIAVHQKHFFKCCGCTAKYCKVSRCPN